MDRLRPGDPEIRFIKRLVLIGIALALALLVYRTAHLLLLAFGAVLGAILLSAIADGLVRRTGMKRGIGLALAVLLVLGALGLMGWLFGDTLANQSEGLIARLPSDWARLQARLANEPLGRLALVFAEQGDAGRAIAAAAARLGIGTLQVLGNLLILLAGAIFFAATPKAYFHGLVQLAPAAYRRVTEKSLCDVGNALRLWLRAQLVSMIVLGALITLGLWLSGIEAAVTLGVLGGLAEFIPYVGPTLAMIPALVIAAAGGGSLPGVIATYVIVRIVQVNLVTPLVTNQLVSIPPGLYLFLILLAGYAFGTFGMFFSGALAVALYTLVIRLYARETLGEPTDVPGAKHRRKAQQARQSGSGTEPERHPPVGEESHGV